MTGKKLMTSEENMIKISFIFWRECILVCKQFILYSLFFNSTNLGLRYSNLLIFTNDMRIFLRIDSTNDDSLLQSDLSWLVTLCGTLGLRLNISKWRVMSFSHRRLLVPFIYHIKSLLIKFDENSLRNLDFTFTHT